MNKTQPKYIIIRADDAGDTDLDLTGADLGGDETDIRFVGADQNLGEVFDEFRNTCRDDYEHRVRPNDFVIFELGRRGVLPKTEIQFV
jgi:hypothetical protein